MHFIIEIMLLPKRKVTFAIFAIIIVILWRIILRWGRAYARLLEADALNFLRNDDGPMLDCTNEKLLQAIIEAATQRGNNALHFTSANEKASTAGASSYYQANSSSGISSDSRNSSFDNRTATPLRKPRQLMQQVGGVSSHKKPVLTLEPHFILKPLRFTHLHQERCHNDFSTNAWYNGAKDGLQDKTKVYRGVREIAFYEFLAFASRQSDLITSCMDLIDSSSTKLSWQSMGYILSCHHTIFEPSALAFLETEESILKRIKDVCTGSNLLKRLALIVAYQAGDEVVTSAFKSYIDTFITIKAAINSLSKISPLTCRYYGVIDLQSMKDNKTLSPTTTAMSYPHLLIENITSIFRHPNIIDLKMGTQTYEPSAPESKQLREIQKYTQQAEFGFRIVGMRVYDRITDEYICKEKSFGAGLLTKDKVIEALRFFFRVAGDSSNTNYSSIVRQLKTLQDWFENHNSNYSFYGGSILIVYEGFEHNNLPEPAVKMIDFAHVCQKQGGDDGCLKGIKTLLQMLHEIRSTIT